MSEFEDLEQNLIEEWDEVRSPSKNIAFWIMPMALFYSGFFGGPVFTLIAVAFVTRLRLEARWALFLIGLSGTTWCLIQGLTLAYLSKIDPSSIYFIRSTLNFFFGTTSFFVVRAWAKQHGYFSSPRTLIVTVCLAIISGLIFYLPPSKIMMAIGR